MFVIFLRIVTIQIAASRGEARALGLCREEGGESEEKLRPNRIFARAVGNNANKVKLYVYSKVNDKIIFSTTNLGNHFIAV